MLSPRPRTYPCPRSLIVGKVVANSSETREALDSYMQRVEMGATVNRIKNQPIQRTGGEEGEQDEENQERLGLGQREARIIVELGQETLAW